MIIINSEELKEFLKEKKGYTDLQALRAEYGFRHFKRSALYLILIFVILTIMGYFKECLIAFIFFKFFRNFAGGIHVKSKLTCFLFSFSLISGAIYTSKFILAHNLLSIKIEVLLFIYIFLIWFFFVPQGTSQRPIRRKEEKSKLKILFFICILLTFFTRFISLEIYTLGLVSAVAVLTLITPPVYWLFNVKHDRVQQSKG